MTVSNIFPVPPTNVLYRILWFGGLDGGELVPAGTAFMAELDGKEYVITARHVAEACQYDPYIRHAGTWNKQNWSSPLVDDNENDITVFQSPVFRPPQIIPDGGLSAFDVRYGMAGIVFGQVGYALGFPGVIGEGKLRTDHVNEFKNMPVPLSTLLAINKGIGTDVVYSASYINAGYSGGAVVYPVWNTNDWGVAGIITHFPSIPRPVMDAQGKEIGYVMQHTGLVGYTPWQLIEHLIEKM